MWYSMISCYDTVLTVWYWVFSYSWKRHRCIHHSSSEASLMLDCKLHSTVLKIVETKKKSQSEGGRIGGCLLSGSAAADWLRDSDSNSPRFDRSLAHLIGLFKISGLELSRLSCRSLEALSARNALLKLTLMLFSDIPTGSHGLNLDCSFQYLRHILSEIAITTLYLLNTVL